jgi:hypothetical protein
MEQSDLLKRLTSTFETLGIPYLITGSVASIAYGEPRFTNDIDVIAAIADFEATFAAAEDVIVKKLQYFQEGGSEKHLRDIVGILKVQGDRIDRAYLADWIARFGLQAEWQLVEQRMLPDAGT